MLSTILGNTLVIEYEAARGSVPLHTGHRGAEYKGQVNIECARCRWAQWASSAARLLDRASTVNICYRLSYEIR